MSFVQRLLSAMFDQVHRVSTETIKHYELKEGRLGWEGPSYTGRFSR